jgi:peptide-methionine (S)-S-oxide reductase
MIEIIRPKAIAASVDVSSLEVILVVHAQDHRVAQCSRSAAGRTTPIPTAATHFANGRKLQPPYPAGLDRAVFGLGCFWGAERKFWEPAQSG